MKYHIKVQLERLPTSTAMPVPPPPLEEVLGNSTLEQHEPGKYLNMHVFVQAISKLITSVEDTKSMDDKPPPTPM